MHPGPFTLGELRVMAEGRHRNWWDGHTIALIAAQTGKVLPYDDALTAGDEDLTTGDTDADWEMAYRLLNGAEIKG